MGKLSKVLLITLLILICFISYSNLSYAFNPEDFKPLNPTGYQNFYNKAGIILGFVRNIGAIVSVLGIAVLGIRYMFGSLEQKANYKETMFPFIVGIAITVGITTIITIVQKVATTEILETTEVSGKCIVEDCGDDAYKDSDLGYCYSHDVLYSALEK